MMSAEPIRDRTELPLDVLGLIDRICDRFEAAWEQGGRPRVEDHLGELDAAYRPGLLRDLLAAEIHARRRRGERPERGEYQRRFPDDPAIVAAAFTTMPDRSSGTPPGAAPRPDTGRDLLFGLIALQNGLIGRDELVAAFRAWAREKTRPLAEHLVARGDLDAEQRAAVEALVGLHLKRSGGDPEKTLAGLSADRSAVEGLAGIGDPEIGATLAHVGTGWRATEAGATGFLSTTGYSVGTATSDGQRFCVLRPHARGGLGAVFVALDRELHREVALKRILDSHADDPISRQRFLLEAEVTGGLEHPGIVPVYGLGTYADGRPFYAMRFVRGDSLKEAVDRFHADAGLKSDPGRRSLELQKLLRRFLDICNAIDYAHSRGVLHRDIKPGNIIVGRHGETFVVDWGLAKAVVGEGAGAPAGERPLTPQSGSGLAETQPGSALGTPAFMSPEQAAGELDRLGPRSDVYSLGATLYCLLAGRPPFEHDDVGELLAAVREGRFPPPRSIDPSIDPALEAICRRAMALRPEGRYESARALADDLERWMADEPVTAWREPFARRARRWARRHQALMMAAPAVILVALVGLGAVLTVQARANGELRQANERERQRFDLAIEAIRRYHTGVSEDFLLRQDQFKDLRDRLLRDAVAFYQKLEGLLSNQTDVRSRRALARAYEEVGELSDKIGSIEESLAMHRKALEVRRALAREAAPEPDTIADVGRSLIAIGLLLAKMGRPDDALAAYAEARYVLGPAAGSGRGRAAILGEIARSYYWTSVIHRVNGRPGEAMTALEQARSLVMELGTTSSVEARRTLAWCSNDIAILRYQDGDVAAALAAFGRSRQIKQEFADEHPGVAEYRRDLANTDVNIGIALRESGKPAEGLASFDAALTAQQSLLAAYPAVTLLQSDLANTLNETGEALRTAGRTDEARASYERALALADGLVRATPTATEDESRVLQGLMLQGLKGLGAVQFDGGRTAEAVATWRRATAEGDRLPPAYGEPLYYLAGCHARLGGVAGAPGSGLSASEGPAELDRAMDLLRRAVAAGYRPIEWMRRDPDLDPLRGRGDFRLLMMDLVTPADPFAGPR